MYINNEKDIKSLHVVDYHKSQQYRQAEREAEQRNRAKEISLLLKDDKALE